MIRVASGRIASLVMLAMNFVAAFSGACVAQSEGLLAVSPKGVIYAGSEISPDMLIERRLTGADGSGGQLASKEFAVGKIARQTLLPGHLIRISALRTQYAVIQGQTTRLVYQQDNLQIAMEGVAMQSGSIGDFVKVRNPQSGVVLEGRVDGNRTVIVSAE